MKTLIVFLSLIALSSCWIAPSTCLSDKGGTVTCSKNEMYCATVTIRRTINQTFPMFFQGCGESLYGIYGIRCAGSYLTTFSGRPYSDREPTTGLKYCCSKSDNCNVANLDHVEGK